MAPSSGNVAASPQWKVKATEPTKGFSPFVAFCFAINYILGTGFLTIPWAFVQGGIVLSSLCLLLVTFLSDITIGYLLESMAWAEEMLDDDMRWMENKSDRDEQKKLLVYSPVINPASRNNRAKLSLEHRQDEENKPLTSLLPMTTTNKQYNATNKAISMNGVLLPSSDFGNAREPHRRQLITVEKKQPLNYLVKQRKFEVNALCRVFLGKPTMYFYTLVLSVYMYFTLWAYTAVFSSAMAQAFPFSTNGDEDESYLYYACAFAAIVVPLSCLELNEQVIVQVSLSFCRFAMVFLMIYTGSTCAEEMRVKQEYLPEYVHDVSPQPPSQFFNFKGIGKMLPILVFATIYHHSLPGLAHPVGDKTKLRSIFRSTCVFSSASYAFIGCSLSILFGVNVEQSSNLNWENYSGGTGTFDVDAGKWVNVALWARAISLYVVCFPAIDVMSAFPLNAITLGNSIMGVVYGRKTHDAEKNRIIVSLFRLLASLPPIIMGILVRDLGTITDYAGTTGFIITFSFPAMLYISSRRKAIEKNFSTITYYSSFFSSSEAIALVLFTFGATMFLYVLYMIFYS